MLGVQQSQSELFLIPDEMLHPGHRRLRLLHYPQQTSPYILSLTFRVSAILQTSAHTCMHLEYMHSILIGFKDRE